MRGETDVSQVYKLLLLVGFISISIATLAAYLTPARGFELSIYRATPLMFWVGFSISLFLSVLVAFSANRHTLRLVALGLGGFSFMNFIQLPLIRSWYYMSKADGLSHLGRARDIESNILNLWDVKYPAIYGLDIYISKFTGFNLEHSFLLVIAIFVYIFLVFVPLTVRLFSNKRGTVTTAVFSGFLLLPINPAAVRLEPHPSSQAIFFITVVIYVVVFTFLHQSRRASILLTLSTFMMVLIHPQQAANILILLGTFAVVQFLHFQGASETTSSSGWPIYSQVTVLGIVFWIWVNANVETLFEVGVARMFAIILGLYDSVAAESVQTRSVSLGELGGSIEELFVKVFLVSVIYCLMCGILMGTSILGLLGGRLENVYHYFREVFKLSSLTNAIIAYWTIGFAAASVLFFIYVIGGITDQYFRHVGFLMVTASVFGALAMGRLLEHFTASSDSDRIFSILTMTIMILFLSLSIPVTFESPYVYQDSHHVTEAKMNGYEIALENTVNENPHTMIRTGVNRFEDAIYGKSSSATVNTDPRYVPDRFASRELTGGGNESRYYRDLPEYFNNTAYLFITEENRQLETSVYRGFRWSEEDFRYLEREPNINRVHDNGEFNLYTVNPAKEN